MAAAGKAATHRLSPSTMVLNWRTRRQKSEVSDKRLTILMCPEPRKVVPLRPSDWGIPAIKGLYGETPD
jgi:hypothetical protein